MTRRDDADSDELAVLRDQIERIDAHLQIQQLAQRYAFAIDARDLDAVVELYVPDISRPDMPGSGREHLKQLLNERMRLFYRTMHQVVGHAIELLDADHARGKVYTRAEHERGDEWIDMAVCYHDQYERRDGTWLFASRSLHPLHVSVLQDRPRPPYKAPFWAPHRTLVPDIWPTWSAFWADTPDEEIARLTPQPVHRRPEA